MPDHKSTTVSDTKLAKNIIVKLLNEIFELHKSANEKKMEKFAQENDIKFIL